jgi:class 3 adenylate cyclase/tetratricopeptide (TPR) repeat protein
MSGPARSLATVLFTDIVGSTERAAELGDRDWHGLLDRHHAHVRREIRRFGGREVNTAGDGFLATFERPARAIHCAWAIREAVRELGLEVRSGLHAGEVEGQARDLSGIVVHTGARVAAQANPGEILVSGTVRDLVAGSGFGFEERGVHTLKGVPGEWRLHAVESLPSGTSSAEGHRWIPKLGRQQALLIGAVVGLLVVAGAIAVATRDSSRIDPETALAAGAAPGIAVMPFQVADPNLAVWREGLVDLLAANLDGVGGLRAISSRTVLAQWHEGVSEGQVPDLRTILKIARDAGGSYAVVGNAVTIGGNVRLAADVYELPSGRVIGAARAAGSPDSLYTLVDRLSIEVLRAILEEDAENLRALPDLASVTTTSLPALKHFLEGEALLRRAEFEEAETAFRRAVEADSTFALAWFGRVRAAEWLNPDPVSLVSELDRALALPDRLSPRERRKAEVFRAIFLASWFRARDLAQELVHSYPDDADAWYLLHWTYVKGPVPREPVDPALASRRAIQLDPTFAPFRSDLLYEVFFDARREDVAEQLAAIAHLAPENHQLLEGGRLAYTLAWGDSAARARAWKAVDTLDTGILETAGTYLIHARFLPLGEALCRQILSRLDGTEWSAELLAYFLMWQGKIEEAIRAVDHPLLGPRFRRDIAYGLHFYRVGTLPDALERELAFQAADTNNWFLAGAYAADRGRWPELAAAVRALRTAGREAGKDSIDARAFGGTADALEGYGLWKRGRTGEALPLLIAGQRNMVGYADPYEEPPRLVCWWIGLLFLDLGKPEEAIPYLHQAPFASLNPYVAYDMATAYAGAGKNREAIDRYRYALTAWRNADPILRPRIETARREIARLGGTE